MRWKSSTRRVKICLQTPRDRRSGVSYLRYSNHYVPFESLPLTWPPSWRHGLICPRRSRPASWRWSKPPRWSGESDELCWPPPLLEHRLEVRLRGLQSIMVRRRELASMTAASLARERAVWTTVLSYPVDQLRTRVGTDLGVLSLRVSTGLVPCLIGNVVTAGTMKRHIAWIDIPIRVDDIPAWMGGNPTPVSIVIVNGITAIEDFHRHGMSLVSANSATEPGPIPKSGRSWHLWQSGKARFSGKSDCIALYSGCGSYQSYLKSLV